MLLGRSEREKASGAVMKISKYTFARLNIYAPQDIDSCECAMPSSTNESRGGTEDLENEFDSDDDAMAVMLD